jgi:hypothetical protein
MSALRCSFLLSCDLNEIRGNLRLFLGEILHVEKLRGHLPLQGTPASFGFEELPRLAVPPLDIRTGLRMQRSSSNTPTCAHEHRSMGTV